MREGIRPLRRSGRRGRIPFRQEGLRPHSPISRRPGTCGTAR
ncbi:hypothetical protein FIU09_07165 [Stenotrophomonas maltophilia]|nr:hypothetical protein [Stenotrophomonas maltophilia]TNY01108.1 hypothetical protein FIU09_07165 [Stenotrophomonas maltophilia]TPD78556.1 hypothetical protein FJN21_08615 [Stenotrophomonas maltophilia]TPD82297.1 hypothetical protein FJN20_11280 [Stenotrophomonas maltophilia]TPD83961.1 hypothetical protein FJN19_08955 [Stenotrophomonas maltophilia]